MMQRIHTTHWQTKHLLRSLLLLLLAAGFFLADTSRAQAATFTVPCTGNAANDGTALQTAVATANSNSQADTIKLAANCTYQLPTALHFGSDGSRLLTVNGNGATLRGGRGAERHVLTVDGQAVATVDRVTLTGGIADGSGGSAGGLMNYGNITLNRSTISGNMGTFDSARAIFIFYTNVAPFPTVTLNNSTVSGNTGDSSNGISSGGVLNFNNSTFANNASGLFILDGKFTANNSIIDNCSTLSTPRGVFAISHSLVESGNCPVSNGVNGNIVGQSAGLLPLTGNPAYHPLPPGSPTLNVGDNALVPAGVTTDQVGNPRLFGTVDMGSMEYQGQPRTVTVATNRASLAEGEAATLTFVRTAPLNDALEIVFTVSGTAGSADRELRDANGQLVTNRMTLPAGSASATLMLSAVDDLVAEADETIVVTLSDTTAYNLGSPNAATATIAANDYLVTKLTDYSGAAAPAAQEGTLRRAIENANRSVTADTITFQGVNGTITLVGGTLTIANQGALTIEATGITLNGNNAVMPLSINSNATVVLNNLTVTGGQGPSAGGVFNQGTLTLNDARITGNRTSTGVGEFYGGGINNLGTLTLNRSVVSNNTTKTAGGGIVNGGTLTLNSSTVSGNESGGRGGGIGGGFVGSITLINSTVSGNRVSGTTDLGGGGIFNGSQLTLINSTVSNNSSAVSAGGIVNQGAMILRNTIVANSSGGDCANSGTRAATNTLVEDGSCNIAAGVNGNKTGDPGLAVLTGNPAFHPLNAGSPAIDAGNNSAVPAGVTVDQSGNQRFFPINGAVDMGAFEFGQVMVALTVDNSNVSEGGTALITVSRVGSLSNPLTVRFVRSGSTSSADYILQQSNAPLTVDEVIIPAGAASVQIAFQAVDDVSAEAAETGVISLVDTNDYNLGAVTVATLNIPANDLVVTNLNDFTTTTPVDGRSGTLRQAILNANSFAGADTITFVVTGVIQLNGGSLRTQGSALTTIEGAGITVDGNGNGSVFVIEGPTTINDLTITGGNAARGSGAENGGGLLVSNVLILNRSTVYGNSARFGGGIYNIFGTVTINNSTIRNNHATEYSGGIWNDEGPNSTDVNMTINNSTISSNTAEHNAGIGVWYGKMVINQSAIVDNLDHQTGLGEDGLVIQAPLEVNNSILSNGLWYFGTLYGHDCYMNGGGMVTFRNSLIRRTWENCPLTNGANGNIVGQEPGLGAPIGNPAYYPLNVDSRAINAGDNALIPAGMTTDQAGNPRIVGGTVDMGPIEFTHVVPPTATPTATSLPVTVTPTATAIPPTTTPTGTALSPTATSTDIALPPTATSTNTHVPPTPTITATDTSMPPTATATNTAVPPTVTSTNTTVPPTATATSTAITLPPTTTPTNTAVPPTATSTTTTVAPTATATPTNTVIPPTATATNTAVPPTATPTAQPTPADTIVAVCGTITVYRNAQGTLSAPGWSGKLYVGSNGANTISGTAGRDLMLGLGGNDKLDGKGGEDLLCGGDGVDLLTGGDGNDYLDSGNGNDVLNGGAGDFDTLIGADGNDVLLDPDGALAAQGGLGNDTFVIAIRNGWRNQAGQARFSGLTAGYGEDTVGLALLNTTPFMLDISGDERDNPPSPLEGKNDGLALVGMIDAASQLIKFERQMVLTASAENLGQGFIINPLRITEASGSEFLNETVGGDEPVEESPQSTLNPIYLPLISGGTVDSGTVDSKSVGSVTGGTAPEGSAPSEEEQTSKLFLPAVSR